MPPILTLQLPAFRCCRCPAPADGGLRGIPLETVKQSGLTGHAGEAISVRSIRHLPDVEQGVAGLDCVDLGCAAAQQLSVAHHPEDDVRQLPR